MTETADTPSTSTRPGRGTPPGGTLGSIGPYVLLERVPGRGPISQFLARQRGPFGFERICWLKATDAPGAYQDTRPAEMLAREAQIVTSLDHPGIIRAYEFREVNGRLLLSFELFSRLSLAHLLTLARDAGKSLPELAIWAIAHALFDALAYGHGTSTGRPSVLHGDLRPSNLWIRGDAHIRLGGFGSGRVGGSDEITAVGTVAERPSYWAPEQVRSDATDERADLFSAALILWELLMKQSATPREMNDLQLLQHLSRRKVASLRAARPDVPALVTTALDLCLHPEVDERTISAEEVAGCILSAMPLESSKQQLRDFIDELGPSAKRLALNAHQSPPSSERPSQRKNSRPRPPKPSGSGQDPTVNISIQRNPPANGPAGPEDVEAQWVSGSDAITIAQRVEAPSPQITIKPVEESAGALNQKDRNGASPSPEARTGSLEMNDDMDRQLAGRTSLRPVLLSVGAFILLAAGLISWFLFRSPGEAPQDEASALTSAAGTSPNQSSPAPSAPTSAQVPVPSGRTTPVPRDKAIILVKSPPVGWVYIQGVQVGPTDRPLEVSCGLRSRFIRVGTHRMPGRGQRSIRWLAPGHPMVLRCGKRYQLPKHK